MTDTKPAGNGAKGAERTWLVTTPVRGVLTSIILASTRREADRIARERGEMEPVTHTITWTGNHRVVREDKVRKP